jgi:hypothetical protein
VVKAPAALFHVFHRAGTQWEQPKQAQSPWGEGLLFHLFHVFHWKTA